MTPSDLESDSTQQGLGEVLLDAGLITAAQLDAARQARLGDQSTADALVTQGVISSRDVAMALSLQLNLPLIDLKRHTVQPNALALVPEEITRHYNAIPMDVIDNELLVVMENPLDMRAVEDISIRAGVRVRPMVGARDDIQQALTLYYRARGEIER